jgi:hypothetical protein
VSRSVVKVRSGDDWETGFVFGDARHVVTSFFVANESGSLSVLGANGRPLDARVVAWSKKGDLAMLEVPDDVGPPLPAASKHAWVPEELIVLYEPQESEPDSKVATTWSAPVALGAKAARVLSDEIDLDVTLWGRAGDYGAPVVNAAGEVIGIISHRSSEEKRPIATRVERATRLLAVTGKQGAFSRKRDWGAFLGFQVTPLAAHHFLGVGLTAGFRYAWAALELNYGFYESGHPTADGGYPGSAMRFQAELCTEAQVPIDREWRLFVGPCGQVDEDTITTFGLAASGVVSSTHDVTRLHPAAVLGIVGGPLFYRVALSEEAHMDVGLVFGR